MSHTTTKNLFDAVSSQAEVPLVPKRSARGARTEQQFIDAANEVFWAEGFSGSTIAQIVSASGLSIGSFYHLFDDKKVLLERATDKVFQDFLITFSKVNLNRSRQHNLLQLLYTLTMAGRKLVARNRGIYRAVMERTPNDVSGYGAMRQIGPTLATYLDVVFDQYTIDLGHRPSRKTIEHATQLLTMSVLQTELGMCPLFPKDLKAFSQIIARATFGALSDSTST